MHVPFCLTLAVCAVAPAQLVFTSPPNVGPDGGSVVSSLQPFNTALAGRRFQYVTDDVRDVPPTGGELITRISMRPDPSAPQSVGRTVDVMVVLDHANFPALTTTFASNYSGSQVTHALGTVNLPSTTSTSGFAVRFVLPSPFLYFGGNNLTNPAHTALLLEFQTTNVVGGTTYSLDCVDGTLTPTVGTSTYLGLQPCVVPPHVGGFDIIKSGPTTSAGQTTFGQHAMRGPISSFGVLLLGLTDPNTDFGGLLCTALRASLDIQTFVFSDAQGAIGSFANPLRVTFPYLVANQSLTLFSQFVMVDPARTAPQLSVSLSDAIRFDMTAPKLIDRRLLWSTLSATAALGTMTVQFVPVLEFN